MRELTVRLRFTSHCLGNVKKHYRKQGKLRHYYLLPRNPEGKVIFMPTWWSSTLKRAAEILCRHHKEVEKVRFALEVEGNPRPTPEQFYRRYYSDNKFSKHEAFFPGDVIGVTCAVPSEIDDDDFHRLMTYAGKYCGMSPGQSNDFGFYVVESIRATRTSPRRPQQQVGESGDDGVKNEPPTVAETVDGS